MRKLLLDEINMCEEDISNMKEKGHIYTEGEFTTGTIKVNFKEKE